MYLTIAICGIWIGAGIATAFSKDSECCGAAMIATIVVVIFAGQFQ